MSEFLVTTKTKRTNCSRCNSALWEGVVNGFTVKVDPIPLDASAEIMLRLEGVEIYQTFRVAGDSFELQKRSAWHITKGDSRAVALAAHGCGRGSADFVELFPKPESKEIDF